MDRTNKSKVLRRNVEIAAEREMRQIEKREHRERKPGEVEALRKRNWEPSATRIHRTKLHEVWNK